ncbi:MAG: ATP-binding protein, partial [Xanthobacteraceae bacterium]
MAELAKSSGELVTKNDLINRVWPGAIVEENALQVHIAAIRKALGPDRDMLKTAFGRGYRLMGSWELRQDDAPPPATPIQGVTEPSANNLPVSTFALIGRDTAVDQLQELLSAYRLVTLVGPGGIGKSTLAVQVGRTLLHSSHGDIFVAELASLTDPQLIPAEVARVLGFRLDGNDISPEFVARAIGQRKLLLILDNCEHLLDACADLAGALLKTCINLRILATSRQAIGVTGESVWQVLPLTTPADG